jgi:hypothetical protein
LAKPKLDELTDWLDAQLQKLPPKSDLAAAIRYARTRWRALTCYLDNGRLEISTNAAENQIRPVALGKEKTGCSEAPMPAAKEPPCSSRSFARPGSMASSPRPICET